MMTFKNTKILPILILGVSYSFTNVQANSDLNAAFNFWSNDNWEEFNYLSTTNSLLDSNGHAGNTGTPDGVIAPGGGGQAFDTEYMFYKYDADANNLSVGLQTGFDVVDGKVVYRNGVIYNDSNTYKPAYYAGDLALSFDGDVELGDTSNRSSTYEYAVDFGLLTRDKDGNLVDSDPRGSRDGIDSAGLYDVSKWDNDISSGSSSPFAMTSGVFEAALLNNPNSLSSSGSGSVAQTDHSGFNTSFWRVVTFNLDTIINEGETFTVDTHWTMSCGNDNINGQIQLTRNTSGGGNPVPEPSVLALFSIGSLSMGFMGYRRRKFKA